MLPSAPTRRVTGNMSKKKEITTAGYIFTGLQILILLAGIYLLRNPSLSIFNQDLDSWVKFIILFVVVLIASFFLESLFKKLGVNFDRETKG
jgi:O-antigen/teichoic acid export membrane protein